jgi:hypothetical protein
MNEASPFTLPVIHLNGTGANSLQQEYRNARISLNQAIEKFHQTTCHPRDFYPVEGSWEKARKEREEMRDSLNKVLAFLEAWEYHAHSHRKV